MKNWPGLYFLIDHLLLPICAALRASQQCYELSMRGWHIPNLLVNIEEPSENKWFNRLCSKNADHGPASTCLDSYTNLRSIILNCSPKKKICIFQARSHYVTQTDLDFTTLPSVGITGTCQHAWQFCTFNWMESFIYCSLKILNLIFTETLLRFKPSQQNETGS